MGDTPKDEGQEPSLELPSLSLGFGRKKRRTEPEPEAEAVAGPPAGEDEPTELLVPVSHSSEAATETSPPASADTSVMPATATTPPPVDPKRRKEKKKKAQPPVEPPPAPVAKEPLPPRQGAAAALMAAVTGVLVGLLAAGLTWGGTRGCEAARGTGSCGGSGLIVLIAILVVMILVGSALLRVLRVADAPSTSFLAVGLVAVIVMLFFTGLLFSVAMVAVLPVLGALSYVLAQQVTSRAEESARD